MQPYVDCYWTSPARAGHAHRVLPDGCIDFLWSLDGRGASGKVVGTMTRATVFEPKESLRIAAVRFKPGGAAAFLGFPANEVTDGEAELRDARLADDLAELGCATEQVRALESSLLGRLADVCEPNARVAAAARVLRNGATVEVAADGVGVSRQYLNRLFLREVGTGPKQFERVMRIQRLREVRRSGMEWAAAALEAGYCDQGHMIRECGLLTGVRPKELG